MEEGGQQFQLTWAGCILVPTVLPVCFNLTGKRECQEGPEGRPAAVQHGEQRWAEECLEHHPGRGEDQAALLTAHSRGQQAGAGVAVAQGTE